MSLVVTAIKAQWDTARKGQNVVASLIESHLENISLPIEAPGA